MNELTNTPKLEDLFLHIHEAVNGLHLRRSACVRKREVLRSIVTPGDLYARTGSIQLQISARRNEIDQDDVPTEIFG